MIIKRKLNQTDGTTIFDHIKKKKLFTFVDGEFETNDAYIIDFWAKYYDSSISISVEEHDTKEQPKKRRGRPKKD